MKRVLYFFCFVLFSYSSIGQSQNIVINELGIAPSSGDAGGGGEFIELYNKGGCPADISCYVITYTSTNIFATTGWTITLPTNIVMQPCTYLLIGGAGTGGPILSWGNVSGGVSWQNSYGINGKDAVDLEIQSLSNSSFNSQAPGNFLNSNNGRGQISLISNTGVVVSSISYSSDINTGNSNLSFKSNPPDGCTAIDQNVANSINHVNGSFTSGTNQGIYLDSNGIYQPGIKDDLSPGLKNKTQIGCAPPPVIAVSPATSMCSTGDSITLTASGAVGINYTWSPSTGLSATTGSSVKAKPPVTTTYFVTGTDANSCTDQKEITITVNPTPNPPGTPSPQRFCYDPAPTVQDIEVFGEPGMIIKWYHNQVGGSPLQPSELLTGKSYWVSQTSANGCESIRGFVNVIITRPTVSIVAPPFCQGTSNNAEVNFYGTPGATVTYTENGAAKSILIGNDGSARISYGLISADKTFVLTGVSLGTCVGTASGTSIIRYVQAPSPDPFQFFCGYPRPTIADLKPSGNGYNWYNFPNDVTPLNPNDFLLGKTYYVSAKDSFSVNGCETNRLSVQATIDIVSPPFLNEQTFCSNSNPTVADVKGNNNIIVRLYKNANDDYRNPLPQNDPLITGTYYARQFKNGCYSEGIIPVSITVIQSAGAPIASVSQQPSCSTKTGTIVITSPQPANGIIYSIKWPADSITTSPLNSFSGLVAGRYVVTYKVNGGCNSFETILFVNAPPVSNVSATLTSPPIPCGQTSGTIQINASNGASPYTYSINNGTSFQTQNTFTGLAAGNYIVRIKDATGCFVDVSTSITQNNSTVTAMASAQAIPCGQTTGTIAVTAANGASPYTYSINNGTSYQTSNSFNNVAAGSYTIKVKDANGCMADVPVTLTQNTSTVIASAEASTIPCGQSTGTITVTASNGMSPYTYSINNGTSYQTSNTFNNLAAGNYNIKVKDVNGCTADVPVTINQNNSTVTATATAPSIPCGLTTGTITLTAANGASPYTYSINNGTSYQASNIFTGVAAGQYIAKVKDANGCTVDVPVTLFQTSSTLSATATASQIACGQTSGTITVNASNGNTPYSYSINNGTSYQTSNIFLNVAPGQYLIKVKDAINCTVDVALTLTAASPSVIASATSTNANCGKNDGSITASAIGGSTYTYSLNNGSFFSNNVFTNLAAGTYKVTVKDAGGCTDDTTILVKQINNAVNQSSSISGCKSVLFNGVTYTNSTTITDTLKTTFGCDSIYRVTNITVQNSPAIIQTSTVNGCDSVIHKNITYKSSIVLRDTLKTTIGCDSVYIITNINVNSFSLTLTANVNPAFEGTMVVLSTNSSTAYQVLAWEPPYLFSFQSATTQRITADSSRLITVTARSNSGCMDTAQLFLEAKPFTDFFVPNAFSPNNDGKNDLFLPMGTTINKGRVRIFNQWGELVFSTDDIKKGWDGTYKGSPQPVGIYVYEVHATMFNGTEVKKKGYINLIR